LATSTNRDDLPSSAGALQSDRVDRGGTGSTLRDLYVVELDPTAAAVIKATYLGGVGDDILGGLAVNPKEPGVVYLTGTTLSGSATSKKFPVNRDAYQSTASTNAGLPTVAGDGFITALDLTKMELIASTFFGGSKIDLLSDIALDAAGNVY